ncbi:hypothetical protein GCM10023169_27770 [Georgenia halophila]|uniref:Uncharacterized protein n=1 Tax=Georgenia halophila TaxID=620889 RepID=A0ABP8LDF2_9MICO
MQVCGLWPFSAGAGTPLLGAPLGRRHPGGATVAANPITWFQHGIINNPSVWFLSIPGVGKSTCVRRMILGLASRGVMPLVLGDLKPDYIDLIERRGAK